MNKVYISADIEGTTGIVTWAETEKDNPHYPLFAEQMTQEVKSACDAALGAGAKSLLVKDAHGSARNIDAAKLPEQAQLMRGWTRDPYSMMAGLDSSFSAAMLVGYHAPAGWSGNPMSHTMNSQNVHVKLNGHDCSETMIGAYTAAMFGVPLVFISGDKQICAEAQRIIPNITTVPVSEGVGAASISQHPKLTIRQISDGVKQALSADVSKCLLELPDTFDVEVMFRNHEVAYSRSYYPGARLEGTRKVMFHTTEWFEVLRFFMFVL